jgi:catechol 2,3-dioxygenase-like lactoylglutathione lyase family enzyme
MNELNNNNWTENNEVHDAIVFFSCARAFVLMIFHTMKLHAFSIITLSLLGSLPLFAEPAKFSKAVVDIGMVAKNIEKTAKFYTEVIGLTEVKGFKASAEKATSFGLTDNQPADIRVFMLGDDPDSTRLKIMSFPKREGARPDQKFIHSTIGISYLTIMVKDMDDALARLKKANIKLLGKTPASLGGKNRITVFHDPDGNFVELIGPVKE